MNSQKNNKSDKITDNSNGKDNKYIKANSFDDKFNSNDFGNGDDNKYENFYPDFSLSVNNSSKRNKSVDNISNQSYIKGLSSIHNSISENTIIIDVKKGIFIEKRKLI